MVTMKNTIKLHFKKTLSPDIAIGFSTKIDLSTYLAIKNNFTPFSDFLKFVCYIEDICGLVYMQYLGVTRSVTHLILKMNILFFRNFHKKLKNLCK